MIRLTPPTPKALISSGWGRPREYRGGWHEGLDFPAPKGSPVLAAAAGKVLRVDDVDNSFAGKWIAIHHGGGIHTRYLHNTKNLVKVGDIVKRGQQIATLGTTGTKNSAPHVHFDVKFKDQAHDEYKRRYGSPTTGWGSSMQLLGTGVPGETFMSGATYSPIARKWAVDRGVVFYSGAGIAATAGVLAAGFLAYKLLK